MPALALALVAVLGGAALVVDRLALDTSKAELRTAAEAAALAAARELANDDRLRPDFDPAALQMKARFAAARIAIENVIATVCPLTVHVVESIFMERAEPSIPAFITVADVVRSAV